MNGLFISLEGPEGSGKSTHAKRIITRLEELGYEVVVGREPGGTAAGEAIRKILQHDSTGEEIYPETETLLFAASRAQLVHAVIKPALAAGKCVVSDRFVDSTTAYQGYGRGFNIQDVTSVNKLAVDDVMPDLTILPNLAVDEGFSRISKHNRETGKELDRMERAGKEFHERVYNGYMEIAKQWPDRITIIDSHRDFELVAEDIWKEIEKLLNNKQDKLSR